MPAFDVEDVISKLTPEEKIGLLSGMIVYGRALSDHYILYSSKLTLTKASTSGILTQSQDSECHRYVLRMAPMVFVESGSSMAPQRPAFLAVLG